MNDENDVVKPYTNTSDKKFENVEKFEKVIY